MDTKKIKIQDIVMLLILSIVFVMSFSIISASLWNDEVYTVYKYAESSYTNIISGEYVSNNHILYSLILKILIDIFGYSEFIVRIPSIIFAYIMYSYVYIKFRSYGRASVGILYSVILIINTTYFELIYQARGYSFIYMCTVIILFNLYEEIKEGNKKATYTIMILSVLAIYTYPMYCIFVGMICIARVFLVENRKNAWLSGIGIVGITIMIYLPLLKEMLIYYSKNLAMHGDILGWNDLISFNLENLMLSYGFSEYKIVCLFMVLLIVLGMIYIYGINQKILYSTLIIYIGTLLVFVIAELSIAYRYVNFLDIIVIFLALEGILGLLKEEKINKYIKIASFSFAIIICIFSFQNFFENLNLSKQYPIENFKEAVKIIKDYPNKQIVIASERMFNWDFYLEKFNVEEVHKISGQDNKEILKQLQEINAQHDVIYIDHVLKREALNLDQNKFQIIKIPQTRGKILIYEIPQGELE